MYKFAKKFKSYLGKLRKTKSSSHSIALGFAIGTFISILPTPGLSVLLGVLAVLLFKNFNKYALFIALALFNPFVTFPLHIYSYKIGNIFFQHQPVVVYEISFLSQIFQASRRLLVGSLILGGFVSFVSYFGVRKFIWIKKMFERKG